MYDEMEYLRINSATLVNAITNSFGTSIMTPLIPSNDTVVSALNITLETVKDDLGMSNKGCPRKFLYN